MKKNTLFPGCSFSSRKVIYQKHKDIFSMTKKITLAIISALVAGIFSLSAEDKKENQMNAEKKIKIALAGDSTVQTYKEPHIAGWGQVIGKYFKDNVVIDNHAMGGRSTKTFIAEDRWDKLLQGKPDFILLQFGHNDSHGKGKPESTDAQTDYKDYLRKYADDAKKANIPIIFITPMHRRTFDKTGKITQELQTYADAMQEVAKEKNVFFIDLYTPTGKLFQDLGDEKSAPFSCKADDRSHFSPMGADELAKLIVADLKKAGSPLKDYLK